MSYTVKCLMQSNARNCVMSAACRYCGLNRDEAERRRQLPLIEDENGIRRKYTGKKRLEGRQ